MFTVVIPLYNKAHTIEKTLASVLNQTFHEFEVIIVNDGSTDDGVKVISEFTSDPRIRVINQENQGVSVARNNGVANARNEYIAFLDGDDEWMPEFLQKIGESVRKFPSAGMYGSASWHCDYISGKSMDSTIEQFRASIQIVKYFDNPHKMPHTSAMVISRKAFYSVFPDGEGFPIGMKCCEDWSCFYRLALKYPIVYIGLPLGVRNNNVPGQVTSLSRSERLMLMKHVVDFYNLTVAANRLAKNSAFDRFCKYDLRHRVVSMLRAKDWEAFFIFWKGLDSSVKDYFSFLEQFIYCKNKFRLLSIAFINTTKILWRFENLTGIYKLIQSGKSRE